MRGAFPPWHFVQNTTQIHKIKHNNLPMDKLGFTAPPLLTTLNAGAPKVEQEPRTEWITVSRLCIKWITTTVQPICLSSFTSHATFASRGLANASILRLRELTSNFVLISNSFASLLLAELTATYFQFTFLVLSTLSSELVSHSLQLVSIIF